MDGKVDMNTDYNGAGDDEDERVLEWEDGLPTTDDLTPLSQSLIPPELASAFSISPEPSRTTLDVQRASQTTMSSLRRQNPPPSSSPSLKALNSYPSTDSAQDDPTVIEGNETAGAAGDRAAGFEPSSHRSSQRTAAMEDSDYVAGGAENSVDDPSSRASKRPRLAWTPQLHKRFVEVVAHLGIKNAVPKTIMQLMNVEGLTRENVASHLQKYRLYLKRMQGISDDGPSSSDHLLTSTQSPREPPAPMPLLYAAARPQMIPMPVMGMAAHHSHGHGGQHMGMVPSGGHHPYPVFPDRPSEWPRGNRYGSAVPFRRGVPTDK